MTSALVPGCDDAPTTPKRPRLPTLEIIAGDNQTGEVATPLAVAPVARLLDSLGRPMAGRLVTFSGDTPAPVDSVITDAGGEARARPWTLATYAGRQNLVASVTLSDHRNRYISVAIHATALAGRPVRAELISGDSAIAIPGTQLDTLVVYIADRFGNRLRDPVIRWTVTDGDGRVDPVPFMTNDTRSVSRAIWTLGPQLGRNALQLAFGDTVARFFSTAASSMIVSTVIVGGGHSCALTPNGTAYCWGLNRSGQLGTGILDPGPLVRKNAVRVLSADSFVSLTAGRDHSCGLAASGTAYCWGDNGAGQLGDGTVTNRHQATSVNAGTAGFSVLAAGGSHTCGLTREGAVLCWGDNKFGQLGDGTTAGHATPRPVVGARTFTALTAGESFTCGIAVDRLTYCWGANDNDQLGAVSAERCTVEHDYYYGPYIVDCSLRPIMVARDPGLVTIAAGLSSACGTARDSRAYCWGAGTPYASAISTPHLTSVFAAAYFGCGLDDGGVIYCWEYGPNGPGVAKRVDSGRTLFASVSAYAYHLCGVAMGASPVAHCWGVNDAGQLGDGTTQQRFSPVAVAAPGKP